MGNREGTRAARHAALTLTPRQQEVVQLLREGYTNGQIAERLGITLDGAKFHVAEIISKLGADSRENAVEIWQNRRRWPTVPAIGLIKFVAAATVAGVGLGVVLVWAAILRGGSTNNPGNPVATRDIERITVTASPDPARAQLVDCPPVLPLTPIANSIVDWVDFVNFDGVSYLGGGWGRPARLVDIAQLGEPYGRVQVNVSETYVNPGAPRADCEAAFLPAGALLYRIDGFDPHFRIATEDGRLYEAYRKQGARTAGEFLDLTGKVEEIVIRDSESGVEVGKVDDPSVVAVLVDQLLGAPFDDSSSSGSTKPYVLEFALNDGTTWAATFWTEANRIWPGIFVPESFTVLIETAVR